MPTIGEQSRGEKIGKIPSGKYVWLACEQCGKERWVNITQITDKRYTGWCRDCSAVRNGIIQGRKNKKWGKRTKSCGYIEILLDKNDPYYAMALKSGYVSEHRYIMAKKLGRCLTKAEIVHHVDGNKKNNCPSNLEMATKYTHKIGFADAYQRGYQQGQADFVIGINIYENH